MNPVVTVVIPSYNRAHLLERTIPTYLQEGVKEIILVDDCSQDNTSEVVKRMQKEMPQLVYIRHSKNMRQPAANNSGLERVQTSWVYFGDDDSILYPGSIKRLYETCMENKVEACGAIAYYMKPGEENMDLQEYVEKQRRYTDNINDIVDLEHFCVNFAYSTKFPIVVPFCQACLIMKSDIAKSVQFDTRYVGNAYREETDFIVRCTQNGATIMFDSRAVQINLPQTMCKGGGAHDKSVWRYRYDMIQNNWYFLRKNFSYLKKKYHLSTNKYLLQFEFVSGFILRPLRRFFK